MPRKILSLSTTALFALLALLAPALAAAQSTSADSLISRASQSRIKGVEGAPVTIIEVSDFECPFCRQFAQTTLAAVDSAFIRTGRARLIFYNLPLPSHPAAWGAAEAALCAGAQDRFWPMHDRLFAEQQTWTASARPWEHFEAYASALGLDREAFRECTQNDRVAPLLIADLMQGSRGGVAATPTFVLVRQPREGENPELAQRVLSGAKSLADFAQAIEELSK